MAEKRMFAKSIVLSDAFLDMPMSARCLYFTLGMLADDDGFVGNPKSIMRQCGASQDDMLTLIQKRYVLTFDSGVIVIKHWRINNFLRNDRHNDTTYIEEKATLMLDEKGAYTECSKVGIPSDNQVTTNGIQVVYPDKNSIEKNSIDKISKEREQTYPSLEEITSYISQQNLTDLVDPNVFYNYYSSNHWLINGKPIADWQAKVKTWAAREKQKAKSSNKQNKFNQFPQNTYNFEELEKSLVRN